jgi:hypothetical protein
MTRESNWPYIIAMFLCFAVFCMWVGLAIEGIVLLVSGT